MPDLSQYDFPKVREVDPEILHKKILQMHLDTDDSNAAGLRGGEAVEFFWD